MIRRLTSRLAAGAALMALCFMLAAPALAARDRTPPTAPTNLRVTGMTSYSVDLAWNPSTDNSGQFSYIICCAYTNSATVPQTATTFTFTAGLEAGRTFTFQVVARDAAGNASRPSNSVTVTLPADQQPPTKPLISVTDVGPTHVSLQLSSSDNGPNIWYTVFRDGTPVIQGDRNTTHTISLLSPGTTYTFTAQARDFAGLQSPVSDPVAVTTEPANASDTTPPTTPGNLSGMNFDTEVWLSWVQSTDNATAQSLIRYEIYLNGVLDHSVVGRGQTILYGTAGMLNTFEVVAVDESGNRSAPAVFTVNL